MYKHSTFYVHVGQARIQSVYNKQDRKMKRLCRHHGKNLVVAVLLSVCMVAQAAETADIIQYRKSVMKARREHIAAATLITQGKVDFKNRLAEHAQALEASNIDTASMFPDGTEAAETNAMSAVWSNKAEFQKRSKDTEQKASKFAKAVATGDTKNYSAHLAELLESCKSCHKDFRNKEDQ